MRFLDSTTIQDKQEGQESAEEKPEPAESKDEMFHKPNERVLRRRSGQLHQIRN